MNDNLLFIQTWIDDNYAALETAGEFTAPYTQAQVYLQLTRIASYAHYLRQAGVVLPEHLLDTLGFNTLMALFTGPMATPEDLKHITESFIILVAASEEINGLFPNPLMDLINEYLATNAAAIAGICAAVATPQEAADAAQALLRIEFLTSLVGADPPPTDIDTAMANLQTQIEGITPTTHAELVAITDALVFITAHGENDQTVIPQPQV